jgi:acyl-CoA thioesterase
VTNPFVASTAVRPSGPGRYEGTIGAEWNLNPLPQGGVITAMALRAMSQELADPGQVVRTLHTTFAAQVADGPVTVEVELLRRGRTMSHLRAEVANLGAARGHLTTGIFGTTRPGFDFTDLTPPADVPPPLTCPSWRDPPPPRVEPFPPMPFWSEVVEARTVRGHPPWDEYVPDRAERVTGYRFDRPPLLDDGTVDPMALVVLADTMPGAVHEKVGRVDRSCWAPSVDLTVHLLGHCRSTWVLAHNRARFAGDGYASADVALWDCGEHGADRPRLVTYATQLFLFTFPT